jgi:hypothetical protein
MKKATHLNYSHRASVKVNKYEGAGGIFQYLQELTHFICRLWA